MGLIIAIIMILAAFFLLRSEWEKVQLKKEYYTIPTKKLKAGESFRILFFSDLHHYLPAVHRMDQILSAIESEKPDAVIAGGDLLCVSKKAGVPTDTGTALKLLKSLSEKYPVFYGEGNHEARFREIAPSEYKAYREELSSYGVHYLTDAAETMADHVRVTGVNLDEIYYKKLSPGFSKKTPMDPGFFDKLSGLWDSESYNIFLMHSPLYLSEARAAGADLVLSGHMHGGTIRLPGGRGLMTPQYQFFVKECSGLHRDGDAAMVVTRGLGTHSIRIRLNDLPELSVITVQGNDGNSDL